MAKTILVVGYGPGISSAVADKFGHSGFSVALVARNEEKLAAGVKALEAKGVQAAAVPADAGDPDSMRAAVRQARTALGPIAVIHWNAYGNGSAGDILTADPTALRDLFNVPVVGLIAAVQEALPDLQKSDAAAVLITNGGFGLINPQVDGLVVAAKYMGLGLANAAKHKLVGILAERLKPDGIYVGEVMVGGTVKGTAWDDGSATIAPETVANKFWELYEGRGDNRAMVA
jgi:short-subunit dehydrogenase